jgi:trehalose 6-phosphate phosphatase
MQQLPSPPAVSSRSTALFLDFDGTLADLAPQPEAVRVVDGLVPLLHLLHSHVGGALAIVSGRRLSDLDGFLEPLKLPSAAEHGAQRRLPDGQLIGIQPPDLRHAVKAANALAVLHAGLRVEIKNAAVALHYRHAPELEMLCRQIMTEAVAASTGVELLSGKFVFEIKPAGVSKGTAIAAFMRSPPFEGRVPLFAGDDVTDEAGFSAVQSLGGFGIKVGEGDTVARYRCPSPATLRQWLQDGCHAAGVPARSDRAGLNTTTSFTGITP